ncbi:MAG: hypothetical protein E7536_08320 [Ruminococcaceae bacterium]|nr:hypothetical protein [Oscillospiraceae bacterium]
MKKISIVLLTLLCFMLVGCNSQNEVDFTVTTTLFTVTQYTSDNPAPPMKEVLEKLALGEENVLDGFTLQDIQTSWGGAHEMPDENTYKWFTKNGSDHVLVFFDENGSVTDIQCRYVFKAEVLSDDGTLLVKPCEGEDELNSADQISVSMKDGAERQTFEAGKIINIEYDGMIAESYPAQISAYDIR